MSKILKIECDLEKHGFTKIFLNEKQIGCVQEFEFKADVHSFRPIIRFIFPNLDGYEKELLEKCSVPVEELKSSNSAFVDMIIEFKKYEVKEHASEPLDESKFRLLATSSVPIEEIDLSKFDQPKSGSIPT